MKTFSERLIKTRIEKGLSQSELAKATQISQNTISRWEKGECIPRAYAVFKLVKFFDIKSDYLLGLSNE